MTPLHHADRALHALVTSMLGDTSAWQAAAHPWSSATYTGLRLVVSCAAPSARYDAALADRLAEADIPLHGGFFADVAVAEAGIDGDGVRLRIEALVIADA